MRSLSKETTPAYYGFASFLTLLFSIWMGNLTLKGSSTALIGLMFGMIATVILFAIFCTESVD